LLWSAIVPASRTAGADHVMGDNRLNIGLGQGNVPCGMKYDDRLALICEGLPIVLESARGFWNASRQLQSSDREATVLHDHAVEEAGKILILLDIARCPKKIVARRIGPMMRWFYDHLARTIYAKAASWSATNVAQLRGYVANERQAHYLDGEYGEYIMPNSELFRRERTLYADIEVYEDGRPHWNRPLGLPTLFPNFTPTALSLAEAFSALGLLSVPGVQAIARAWDALEFSDAQTAQDSDALIRATIAAVIGGGLASDAAEQHHVNTVYGHWQMPMYNFDFDLIRVPRDALESERERLFNAERGGW
jgi:hypothetical protein